MSFSTSQLIPLCPPFYPPPLGNHVCFLLLWLYFCFINRFICTVIFRFQRNLKKACHIFVFLCLIYFIQYENFMVYLNTAKKKKSKII